jgi:hypothetical protein
MSIQTWSSKALEDRACSPIDPTAMTAMRAFHSEFKAIFMNPIAVKKEPGLLTKT